MCDGAAVPSWLAWPGGQWAEPGSTRTGKEIVHAMYPQAARRYQRALRRAALYAAGGTLGALALYGLIRMQQRAARQQQQQQQLAASSVEAPVLDSTALEAASASRAAVSRSSIRFR